MKRGTISATFDSTYPEIQGYEVLSLIGEGAFGEVYSCRKLSGDYDLCAIKVIRIGLASRQIISRFESESEALSRCDHPNIARVYSVGSTINGQPYIAMEYCSGIPLSEWLESKRPTLKKRIKAFTLAVAGVEHAHSKGIIHRDLKPKNIMVDDSGDEITVKVIDFGLAKALHDPLGEYSTVSARKAAIGTWDYMSPEQAMGLKESDSVRSDVYSLGCVLFYCLTGAPPHGKLGNLPESVRLKRLNEDLISSPSIVNSDPVKRGLHYCKEPLTRELDWITLKALSIDPLHRYSSVAELLSDLYVDSNQSGTLLAKPQRLLYRIGFYFRLNRWPVGIASLVILTLSLSLSVVISQRDLARNSELAAQNERDIALHKTSQVERLLRAHAETLTSFHIPEVAEMLRRNFKNRSFQPSLDEKHSGLNSAELEKVKAEFFNEIDFYWIAREVVDLTLFDDLSASLEQFSDDPGLSDRWVRIYAQSLRRSGQAKLAYDLQSRVQDNFDAHTPLSEDAWRSRKELAQLCFDLGRYYKSEQLVRILIDQFSRLENCLTKDLASFYMLLGAIRHKLGHNSEALVVYQEGLNLIPELPVASPDLEVAIHSSMGVLLKEMGDWKAAEESFLKARQVFENHRDSVSKSRMISFLNNVASFEMDKGNLDEAEASLRNIIEVSKLELGLDHEKTMVCMENLASCLLAKGDIESAGALYEKVLLQQEKFLGKSSLDYLVTLNNLGALKKRLGEFEIARKYYDDAILGIESYFRGGHPLLFKVLLNRSVLEMKAGENEKALGYFQKSHEFGQANLDLNRNDLLFCEANIGYLLGVLDQPHESLRVLSDTLPQHLEIFGESHQGTRLLIQDFFSSLAFPDNEKDIPSFLKKYSEILAELEIESGFPVAIHAHFEAKYLLKFGKHDEALHEINRGITALRGVETVNGELLKSLQQLGKENR